MSEKKYRCSNCGKILTESQKFCTSCGAKNEFIEYNDENLQNDQNLSSEASSSNTVDNQGVLNIQNQETESEAMPQEVSKNINAPEEKASKPKNGQKKIIVAAGVIAAVLLLVFCGFKVYALINPNYVPMKAIVNTIKICSDNEKDYINNNPFGKLLLDDSSQHELQLKISDINTGSNNIIPKNIQNMLSEYVLTLKTQYSEKDICGNMNVNLKNSDDDIIDGDIYYSNEKIVYNFPDLMDDILGLRFNDPNSQDDKNRNVYSKESIDKFNKLVKELNKEYMQYYIHELNFKKGDKNSYTATLDSERLILITESYIMKLAESDDFRNIIISSIANSSAEYDEAYYQDYYDSIVLQMKDLVKCYINDYKPDDITINIVVEKNIVKSIYADTKFYVDKDKNGFKLSFELQTNKENKLFDISYKFKAASDSSIMLTGNVTYDNSKTEAVRTIANKLSSDDLQVKYNLESTKKSKSLYEDNLKLSVDTYDSNIGFSINNSYEQVSKDNIDINQIDMHLTDDSNGIEINLMLEGSLKNDKIDNSKLSEPKNIVYIDELNENDMQRILEKLEKQLTMKFGTAGGSFNL